MERKTQITKNKTLSIIVFLVLSFVTFSCNQVPLSETEFNATAWKDDKNGCKGEREKLTEDLENAKEKIIGMSENQIRLLLGSPDKVQLFERSQKFYIYFIEGGSQCGGEGTEGRNYQVRFSSLNQVNEISLVLPLNN